MSNKIYYYPVTPEYVEEVIKKEKPDGILLGFGGQTALNCGVELSEKNILQRNNVKVLGTPIEGIQATEDRGLFKEKMRKAGIPVPQSKDVNSVEEARKAAKEIGYPVIIRVAYTLGGKGGGLASNEYELDEIAQRGLSSSLANQILVEKYVGQWKQIEFEVMRDCSGNSITVCDMENVLSMRVHTGDNIVVAPSQTINNREYHMLRRISIEAAEVCNILGECNIQFALDTNSEKFYVIEINPRLSRSSALASKATGYPIAYIATKLTLGYTLAELTNKVTGVTTSCFEPSLDYLVLKMPRWDLTKFDRSSRILGPQMKSVGEVMAVGRRFEEALQKAVRMSDINKDNVMDLDDDEKVEQNIEDLLNHPNDEIIFHVAKALSLGMEVDRIRELTFIDPWFINKINNIVQLDKELRSNSKRILDKSHAEMLYQSKKLGFSDENIASITGTTFDHVRKTRITNGIVPAIKQIDTLAAEWPAKTNYLYLTYGDKKDDIEFKESKKVIVLGSGTYRIGSSVEFDWSTMHMVWSLKKRKFDEVIIINCNPETVSTDYDMSDKLYFEEIKLERILDINDKEKSEGVVTSVGGQTPNNIAPKIGEKGIKIIGSDSKSIDGAENRSKFSKLLDSLGIAQPEWEQFSSMNDVNMFVKKVGYPILVRPSYVLSGAAMKVIWTSKDLEKFLIKATTISPEYPVVISKFIQDALEIEVDAVSNGKEVYIGAIIEHIDKAGIHSGDAVMVIPPYTIKQSIKDKIVEYTEKIAKSLSVKGPFNIQFLVKDNNVLVIECNLRASRSMPFVSKVKGINLIDIAAESMINNKLPITQMKKEKELIGIKVPQFSFMQIEGADPHLGVEMQSTGEAAAISEEFNDALIKAFQSAGYKIPKENGNILITIGGEKNKKRILPIVKKLQETGYIIFSTKHTGEYLKENKFDNIKILYKMDEIEKKPNLQDFLVERKFDLIINIPSTETLSKYKHILEDEYSIRRKAVELGIPVMTTLETAQAFGNALKWLKDKESEVK